MSGLEMSGSKIQFQNEEFTESESLKCDTRTYFINWCVNLYNSGISQVVIISPAS